MRIYMSDEDPEGYSQNKIVGVWPVSQNPYPIYDQNLQISLLYLRSYQKFGTLFMAFPAGPVVLSIIYNGLC